MLFSQGDITLEDSGGGGSTSAWGSERTGTSNFGEPASTMLVSVSKSKLLRHSTKLLNNLHFSVLYLSAFKSKSSQNFS